MKIKKIPLQAPGVDLLAAIDRRVKRVSTQSLDISFNELYDMKRDGEINITPEYQRLFRWSDGAQSRFIESLLLEMPVPPIFVLEEEDGRYVLIDGLQRISSYLHLRGVLDAPYLDPPVKQGEFLTLVDCDIVPELNGRDYNSLGTTLQIRLKRAFIRVEVVRKGSDAHFKYHMFKRLNTGGINLSPQQMRNCTIRLLDATFNDFIKSLCSDKNFRECIDSITEEQKLGAYDEELALRFFAFKNDIARFRHDVSDFMTEYMESVSDPDIENAFDYDSEEAIFKKTFAVLCATLGDKAFARAGKTGSLTKGFTVYHYESFTIGLQPLLSTLNPKDRAQMSQLREILTKVKQDAAFIGMTTGGGKNSPGPLRSRIKFVTEAVEAGL